MASYCKCNCLNCTGECENLGDNKCAIRCGSTTKSIANVSQTFFCGQQFKVSME